MDLSRIEEALRQNLKVQSVALLDKFPCSDYSEFLRQCQDGRLEVLTAYDAAIVPAIGTRAERIMHNALLWSPALISLILVGVALAWADAWVLVGVPLAFLGFFLSTPAFMKTVGSSVLLGALVVMVGGWYRGNYTSAILAASFVGSNYLVSVARTQCDMLIRNAIATSELVLVWLYLQRSVVLHHHDA